MSLITLTRLAHFAKKISTRMCSSIAKVSSEESLIDNMSTRCNESANFSIVLRKVKILYVMVLRMKNNQYHW